ncbi:MAG TPA: prolipoprotein diacylglyceryl transferase family protein [Candidatus Bathyarchaeia archaeon]|nr:prolipoprotein diacylglyceryl transferase family protein [Candidatus Bathyarchaeia archaeon]
MLPILFKIGEFSFSSLGLSLALAFLVCFFIIWRRLREANLNEEKIVDAFLFSVIGAIIMSRAFYILLSWPTFKFNLIKWLYFNYFPGFTFTGALVGFLLSFYFFSRRQKWNFYKVADELIFGLLPFAMVTELGIFLDGSDLGAETGMPWGLFFPGDMVRRHPVSLFKSLLFLSLWVYFLRIERIWRSWNWYRSHKEGFILINFVIFTSVFKLALAFLKPIGLYSVLVEKVGSLSLLVMGIIWLYMRSGRDISEDLGFTKKISILKDRFKNRKENIHGKNKGS